MALFKYVVEAYVASRELDTASLSRLAFWTDALGDRACRELHLFGLDEFLRAIQQLQGMEVQGMEEC